MNLFCLEKLKQWIYVEAVNDSLITSQPKDPQMIIWMCNLDSRLNSEIPKVSGNFFYESKSSQIQPLERKLSMAVTSEYGLKLIC